MNIKCTDTTPLYNIAESESAISRRKYSMHYNLSQCTKYTASIKTRSMRCGSPFKLAQQYLHCAGMSSSYYVHMHIHAIHAHNCEMRYIEDIALHVYKK